MITDEEIDALAKPYCGMGGVEDYRKFAHAIYQLGRKHQSDADSDCDICTNRNRINHMSQESTCSHCKWQGKWKDDLFVAQNSVEAIK